MNITTKYTRRQIVDNMTTFKKPAICKCRLELNDNKCYCKEKSCSIYRCKKVITSGDSCVKLDSKFFCYRCYTGILRSYHNVKIELTSYEDIIRINEILNKSGYSRLDSNEVLNSILDKIIRDNNKLELDVDYDYLRNLYKTTFETFEKDVIDFFSCFDKFDKIKELIDKIHFNRDYVSYNELNEDQKKQVKFSKEQYKYKVYKLNKKFVKIDNFNKSHELEQLLKFLNIDAKIPYIHSYYLDREHKFSDDKNSSYKLYKNGNLKISGDFIVSALNDALIKRIEFLKFDCYTF